MTPKLKKIVVIATRQELTDRHYFLRLWLAMRNMGISRRKWPDELAGVIYGFDGVILCPDGRPWPVPDVDRVLGDPRWISMLLEDVGGAPRRFNIRKIEALRLIDLYFRIKHPHIQRHFGR
jgi:hypothetical protein